MSYDPDIITNYFDEYGLDEWKRLISSPKNLMSLQIHQHYLKKYILPNQMVLELGAGSGRYSIFMAKLGAKILTSDISSVQLDLNKKHVTEAGQLHQFLGHQILDITNLAEIKSELFDVVVAIGGPLSYTLDKRDQAMQEVLRVTKSGGLIFLGVMSRYGSMQRLIASYTSDLVKGDLTIAEILETGDDLGYLAFKGHHHHMFTYRELQEFLSNYPVTLLDATANSYLTIQKGPHLQEVVNNVKAWQKLFEMELHICKEMVDGGTHMLVVIRKGGK